VLCNKHFSPPLYVDFTINAKYINEQLSRWYSYAMAKVKLLYDKNILKTSCILPSTVFQYLFLFDLKG